MHYRSQRYPADIGLRVQHRDEIHRAWLVNVSATGARLVQLPPLPKGALVTLLHLDLRIQARVVWSQARYVGVRFEAPLSDRESGALRGVGGRSAVGAWSSAAPPFRELS